MSSRLLLIDPDQTAQDALAGILQREDRFIEGVHDGLEAMDQLRASHFDVVLAGNRNGCDGLKLVRKVHKVQPLAKVILVGEPEPTRILSAIRARAFSYIHNPPPPGPLSEIVQQALDSSHWRDDIVVISARPEWITLDIRCKMEAADRMTHLVPRD